jgi:hypothetical protein
MIESDKERHEFLRQFEVANLLCPAGAQVVYEAQKFLTGQMHFLELAVQNYCEAEKATKEIKVASILPMEQRHRDEKLAISTRLGYPDLDPWCAADKVMDELNALKSIKPNA